MHPHTPNRDLLSLRQELEAVWVIYKRVKVTWQRRTVAQSLRRWAWFPSYSQSSVTLRKKGKSTQQQKALLSLRDSQMWHLVHLVTHPTFNLPRYPQQRQTWPQPVNQAWLVRLYHITQTPRQWTSAPRYLSNTKRVAKISCCQVNRPPHLCHSNSQKRSSMEFRRLPNNSAPRRKVKTWEISHPTSRQVSVSTTQHFQAPNLKSRSTMMTQKANGRYNHSK